MRLVLPLATFVYCASWIEGGKIYETTAVSSVEDLVITFGFKDAAEPSAEPLPFSHREG